MQEKEALIDIYDSSGSIIGMKKRSEIDKTNDILKAVYILLANSKKQLSLIKAQDSLWKDKWGSSCGGLVRSEETPLDAAKRTVKRELRLSPELKQIYEGFHDFNGVKRWVHVFHGATSFNPKPNIEDVSESRWFSQEEIASLANEDVLMPTTLIALEALGVL